MALSEPELPLLEQNAGKRSGFPQLTAGKLSQLGPVTEDPKGRLGGRQVLGGGVEAAPPQPFSLLQVGQYVSRAEELKAIVSSSNQALLRQGPSAQDLLRGRPQPLADPPSP